MKILIDLLHPAHVHIFRNFIREMENKGHTILVTARDKDVTIDLLNAYKIKHLKISKAKSGFKNSLQEFIFRNVKLYKIIRKFKPDFLLGNVGICIAPLSLITNVPAIVLHNNESAKLTNPVCYRLAKYVVTAQSYEEKVPNKNHFTYDSCHELAYLHPNRFNPDKNILKEIKANPEERLIIVRLVSLQAVHDVGVKGINDKLKLIHELEKYGRVLITSEDELSPELKKYQVKVAPEKLHDLLAMATLCIGESATLASEAAVLGVPAIYVCSSKRGYTNEQECRFGLVYNYDESTPAIKKALELLQRDDLKEEWNRKRAKLLAEQVDFTTWLVDFFAKVERKK